MRDTSTWSKKLRKALEESKKLGEHVEYYFPDESFEKKQRRRLARLIANVELGLTLLRDIASSEPAIAVRAFLSGYRYPVPSLQNDDNWRKVRIARFYLIRLKGEMWEGSLEEYIGLPEELRIFELETINDVPEVGYTSVLPGRLDGLYRPTLTRTPAHTKNNVKQASVGLWYAKVSVKGNSPEEVPIYIPQAVADLNLSNTVSFEHRQATNPSYTVSRSTLLAEAESMDRKLAEMGQDAQNYHQRLSGVNFQLFDSDTNDYHNGDEIRLEKLIHIVGLLNVGKSTLLEILIYHLAKKGYRCALVVDNVPSQVRLASLFWFGLGIPAAPILGKDRHGHLKKAYEPILMDRGEDIYKGGTHPAWRWFSPVCPLLALNQSETIWNFGDEPCHQLKQKEFVPKENDDDIEFEEQENEKLHTCPFYYRCPRHQVEKDIATAKVWLLTPASLIHTPVPRQLFKENMRFAELVYRECNFTFFDEADRVKTQIEDAFAPSELLLDNSQTGFLNKLGLNLNPIYRSNRTSMTADLFESWTNAQYDAQKAINRICPKLYEDSKLVNWLGNSPFTGRSLFARLIGELVNPKDTEAEPRKKLTRTQKSKQRKEKLLQGLTSSQKKQQQKELLEDLRDFWRSPLNPKTNKLASIALTLLSAENDEFVFEEIERWWNEWLKAHKDISKPNKEEFEYLQQRTYFSLLITVLENRLSFLVDRLNIVARLIDLHELRQWLVDRPPFDYLPIVPNSPVGNILGFKYTRDRTLQGGKLEYFRYVGVGSYLLLNFPTLFDVDNREGCHTVLISGTSYAPGSPAYHINKIPQVLLTPALSNNKAGDAGIADSEFYFRPQQHNGEYIAISGLLPDRRKQADEEMVKAICDAPGKAKCFVDRVFQELAEKESQEKELVKQTGRELNNWRDRSRILVINGSYVETDLINKSFHKFYRRLNTDAIKALIRDSNPNPDDVPRGKLEGIKNTPVKILSAPLPALERGHNILNENKKAAFGAGIFINRPMPVPDDWQATVRQLNAWTLKNVGDAEFYRREINILGDRLNLDTVSTAFYKLAVNKMIDLNCRAMSYKQLSPEERSVLCWTQLVSIWQVIGRLVRGGVPCLIYFLDVRFADNFTEDKPENETTSLLVGIIKELEQLMQSGQQYELKLAQYLYSDFLKALKDTDQLDY